MAGSPGQCLFLSLPLELRNPIYSQLLSTKHTRVDTVQHRKNPAKPQEAHRYVLAHAYHFQPAILCCNRQINEEATAIFRENLFVSVSLSGTSAEAHRFKLHILRRCLGKWGLPVLAHDENARSFKSFAMEIHLGSSQTTDSEEMWWNSPKPQQWESRPKIVVVADDLLRFSKILILGILRTLRNTRIDALEATMLLVDILPMTDRHDSSGEQLRPAVRKLLEPLCFLHNLGFVVIEGSAPKWYIDEVKQRIQRRAPSSQELFHSMARLKEQGDVNVLSNDLHSAALQYEAALNQLWSGSHWGLRDETVVGGSFNGVHVVKALKLLQWRLHLSLATTNFRLEKYATAHNWTNIVQHDHQCTDYSVAHLWYYRAWASERLGETKYAYEEMRQARVRQPRDEVISTHLAVLKSKLDVEESGILHT
ncbi:hypothetical protein BDR22DRAFT_826495 [Usnea florida]